MCVTLTAVMVSQVFACVQTHPIICTKYVQAFVCQFYLNEAVQKIKKNVLGNLGGPDRISCKVVRAALRLPQELLCLRVPACPSCRPALRVSDLSGLTPQLHKPSPCNKSLNMYLSLVPFLWVTLSDTSFLSFSLGIYIFTLRSEFSVTSSLIPMCQHSLKAYFVPGIVLSA